MPWFTKHFIENKNKVSTPRQVVNDLAPSRNRETNNAVQPVTPTSLTSRLIQFVRIGQLTVVSCERYIETASTNRIAATRAQPLGVRGSGLPTFSLPLQFWMFFYVFFEKLIFSRVPFQLYTRLNDLKFHYSKYFLGMGSPSSSPDPSPALSQGSPLIRASSSNLRDASRPRFGLHPIWTPNFWSVVAPLRCCIRKRGLFQWIVAIFSGPWMPLRWKQLYRYNISKQKRTDSEKLLESIQQAWYGTDWTAEIFAILRWNDKQRQ